MLWEGWLRGAGMVRGTVACNRALIGSLVEMQSSGKYNVPTFRLFPTRVVVRIFIIAELNTKGELDWERDILEPAPLPSNPTQGC